MIRRFLLFPPPPSPSPRHSASRDLHRSSPKTHTHCAAGSLKAVLKLRTLSLYTQDTIISMRLD